MKTMFFDWNEPLLPRAARFLVEKFTRDDRLDMRSIILALPGSRAVARLEELLLEEVEKRIKEKKLDSAWFSPKILTIGRLPELLYPVQKPLAGDLVQQFAWIKALDKMQTETPDVLARLLPHPPEQENFSARIALARIFARLHRELAGETFDFEYIARKCREFGITNEAMRWDTLSGLQVKYLRILDKLGFWDLQTARLHAIKNKEPETENTIVLIGTVDMNLAQKKILELVSPQVISLVFAPLSHRGLFDDYGCIVAQKWKTVPIAIRDEQIEVAVSPVEQSAALARWLSERLDGTRTAEEIVLGVPSEELIPFVRQQLQQAGAKTRPVLGISMEHGSPYLFLKKLAEWVQYRRFSDFADLLRHPEVESYLHRVLGKESERLLVEIDEYHTLFLPDSSEEEEKTYIDPTDPRRNRDFSGVHRSREALQSLFAPLFSGEKKTTCKWARILSEIIETVFSENGSRDEFLRKSLSQLEPVLESIAEIPGELLPEIFSRDMFELVLRELQSIRIPLPSDKNAIEILGWLDLAMDDAPVLAASCMNEGIVPSSLSADLFLPDRIRKAIGIEDNDRRFARDAYVLSVILSSRSDPDDVRLIAGRRSAQGDPLLPSRLFFATDPETIAKRVERFFSARERSEPTVFPGTLRPGSETPNFRIPEPIPLEKPVLSMRITEFRDYLACPYRYYLKHRLGLDILDDHAEELDAADFGNLAHEVLRRFGLGAYRDSTSSEEIELYLDRELDIVSREIYGENPRPVLAIQLEQLRFRLKSFANWQSQWALQGNRILCTELSLNESNRENEIAGIPPLHSYITMGEEKKMFLRGRIDRIDMNERTGQWFLFDYKSSDADKDPGKVHLKKSLKSGESPQWTDLQLPLYRHVMEQSRRLSGKKADSIRVGYIVLPKDVSKTGERLAEWDSKVYESALETAKQVVRDIWEEKFSPQIRAKTPPPFTEMFSPICMDNQPGR